MKLPIFPVILLVLAGVLATSCSEAREGAPLPEKPYTQEMFNQYWYSGKAELTSYQLKQARYGEIHSGTAVLIFVTEDFLPDRQVKYEQGPRPDNVTSVLKLNFMRNFLTGVYPYSMMTSVFTPVNQIDRTLKLSSSAQEWCGHAYMQLNRDDDQYRGVLYSYFQAEGDQEFNIPAVLLEDELWNRVRLNPDALPTGVVEVVPGSQFLRFRHQECVPHSAVASLDTLHNPAWSDSLLKRFRLEYRDIPRTLEIVFEARFPYQIVYWEEEMLSGFGAPTRLKTTATRIKSIQLEYWSKNSLADTTYREMLGL